MAGQLVHHRLAQEGGDGGDQLFGSGSVLHGQAARGTRRFRRSISFSEARRAIIARSDDESTPARKPRTMAEQLTPQLREPRTSQNFIWLGSTSPPPAAA